MSDFDLPFVPPTGTEEDSAPLERKFFEIKHAIVTITPEQAAEWLGMNLKNRTERHQGSDAYRRDVENDEWMVTGDTIKFDWFGVLVDGQHRLRACVLSGKPIKSLVVWGVDPKARRRVDTGMTRSFRDDLKMFGTETQTKYAQTISVVARRLAMWDPPNEERVNFGHSKVTKYELERALERHPELEYCVSFVDRLSPSVEVSPSTLTFIFWVLTHANPDEAKIFVSRLADGVGLEEGDPILVLRNWVFRQRGKRLRNFEGHLLWRSVLAWNLWMRGKRVSKLQLPKGGMSAESFPRLRVKKSAAALEGQENGDEPDEAETEDED